MLHVSVRVTHAYDLHATVKKHYVTNAGQPIPGVDVVLYKEGGDEDSQNGGENSSEGDNNTTDDGESDHAPKRPFLEGIQEEGSLRRWGLG